MRDTPPRVFISYSQESDEHSAWVLALAHRLAEWGVEAIIDRFCDWPEHGWRAWMSEQIEAADWVLVVCTTEYLQRFEGNAPADIGRGVRWESQHITQQLYDHKFRNKRFVPVLPPGEDEVSIPFPLKDYRSFRPDSQYEDLYRLLTDQPATPAPELGPLRRLPPIPVPTVADPTPAADSANAPERVTNPYPGLAAFTPEQHTVFFGREADTVRVLDKLTQNGFASIVGGSGTGKSSLVGAGVVPALRAVEPTTGYLRFKPQADPLRQLAEAFDRKLPEEKLALGKPRLERLREALETAPDKVIADHLLPLGQPLLVFCDQFEELFTQTPKDRAATFQTVFEALRQCEGLRLILTLRSEFMDRLMDWLGGEAFENSLLTLDPIRDDVRLRAIITGPAEKAGVAVEPDLLTELLPAAHSLRGALPLLALALERLFADRDPRLGLTLAAYQKMGSLAGIVEAAAAPIDEAIDADPTLQAASEKLFAALATVIDGLPTRRTAPSAPLRVDPPTATLLDALRSQGFVTDPDPEHVELAHEALLLFWPRLSRWCERYADKLALRRQAEHAAQERARADRNARPGSGPAQASLQSWGWERQRQALLALLALDQRGPIPDPDFRDPGIDAWRALEDHLAEPLLSFLRPEPLTLLAELASDETPHDRREDIGRRLNQMGDPRAGVGLDADGLPEFLWIDIPPGSVTLDTRDKPTFPVAPLRIARYPVTWLQYRAFLEAEDGYRDQRCWGDGLVRNDQPGELRWPLGNHPAINVSWHDSMAFCDWLNGRLHLVEEDLIRLPTEWEWQWVAQGGYEAREYPWGNDWNEARANSRMSGIGRTTAVGMYTNGCPGLWPVMDLAGTVWDWCLNERGIPENTKPGGEASRVLRGGSWVSGPEYCPAAYRDYNVPDLRLNYIGFRVCRGSPIAPLPTAPQDTETRSR